MNRSTLQLTFNRNAGQCLFPELVDTSGTLGYASFS